MADPDRHTIGALAAVLFGILFAGFAYLFAEVVTMQYSQEDMCEELRKFSQRQGVPLQIQCPPHEFGRR